MWSPLALERVDEAAEYIGRDRPESARRWVLSLFRVVGRLESFLESGRFVPEISDRPDLREVIHGEYRIIYRVEAEQVGGEPKYFISVIEDITRRKRAESLLKSLSPEEIEVLGEMARGRTNSEIADEPAFSVNTIKTRVKGITEKLGVSDRTQAAVHAAETGILDESAKEEVGIVR